MSAFLRRVVSRLAVDLYLSKALRHSVSLKVLSWVRVWVRCDGPVTIDCWIVEWVVVLGFIPWFELDLLGAEGLHIGITGPCNTTHGYLVLTRFPGQPLGLGLRTKGHGTILNK